MNIGDLVFVQGTSWIDRAIEYFTKSKWSHVAIYVGDGQCIEAQGQRTVGFQSLSFYPSYDVISMNLNAEQQKRIVDFLYSQIGKPYDYVDILILFVRCVFKIKIPWHETHKWICSRLACDAERYAGKRAPTDDNVTPEDLYEFYQAS